MAETPRISKDDARQLLNEAHVAIIDVRSQDQWRESGKRVVHAAQEDRSNVKAWAHRYDRENTLIVYCA